MPRQESPLPKYRKHPNGQAFIYHRSIPNKSHRLCLGKYGSPESKEKYHQVCRRIELLKDAQLSVTVGAVPEIRELIAAYDDYASLHYSRGGKPTAEYGSMVNALGILHGLYADELAADFGPKAFKTLQRWMAAEDYARSHISQTTSRLKRFFRWCCEEELVDPLLHQRLTCVRGLTKGEFGARESEPIRPAKEESIFGVLPFLSPTVAGLVQVQYYCGMRPGEACRMRPCDVDTRADVWLYTPAEHKNAWRGRTLVKAIPRVAQDVLRPLLKGRGEAAYLFSPQESLAWMLTQQATSRPPRKTKRFPCEVRRVEREKKRASRRQSRIREFYTKDSYRQAVDYGFAKAKRAGMELERFTPNQLRHAIVTLVARTLGQQKAQRYAGHESLDTTRIYTEIEVAEIVDIARQLDSRWHHAS